MAANGPKEQVAWDLDWDDLTGGSASAPPPPQPSATIPPPVAPVVPQPTATPVNPPPLPRRAFPSPATAFPTPDSAPIVAVQHLPTSASAPPPPPNATPSIAATAGTSPRMLVHGQRVKLADFLPGNPPPAFEVALTLAPAVGQTLDLCCFGLDENGKLSDDRYFVFFNQKSSPGGAIALRGASGDVFGVDLARLPGTVRRLVFTATVDGAGSVRALGKSRFELRGSGGQALARYEFAGNELDEVQALMVAEIYAKDGVWRVSAVGQGFKGGLSEVLRHFGGQEI